MKKKLLLIALFCLGVSSLQASQTITTEKDLKEAISKLILDKASVESLKNVSNKVDENSMKIQKIQNKLLIMKNKKIEKIVVQKKTKPTFINGKVFHCWVLHLRKGPSIDTKIRGYLNKGETVKVLSMEKHGWFSVMSDKGSGWVSGRYITEDK